MRTYTIGSNEFVVQKNSLNYSDKINERTTCSFTVIQTNSHSVELGMEVSIDDENGNIFRGSVDNTTLSADNAFTYIQVQCVDFSQLIDKRIVFDTASNEYAGEIVRILIADFFSNEGITEGIIQDGPIIAQAVFNYDNGNIAMNYLAEVTGFNWYIDRDKKLHFFNRSTFSSPFTLTDLSGNYSGMVVQRTRSQYRNKQYIRAGLDTTEELPKENPSPKPDGVSRTFIVRLPVAQKPRIFINDIELDPNEIGVNGLDKDRKFYFSYNSNVITQDSSETVLSATENIEVSYKGLYPIIVVSENTDEILERKSIEGGTGIYENVIEEQNLNTRQAAFDFAFGKLEKFGLISNVVTFQTYNRGLSAGQLLSISNTKFELSGNFLIESVNARDDNGITKYAVKCLDGSSLGGWEQFFKTLVQGNRKLVIRENEVLVLVQNTSENQGWNEETIPTVFTCPIPTNDMSSIFLTPFQIIETKGLFPSVNLLPC